MNLISIILGTNNYTDVVPFWVWELGANNYFFFKIHFCNLKNNLWIFSTILQGLAVHFTRGLFPAYHRTFSGFAIIKLLLEMPKFKEIITLGNVWMGTPTSFHLSHVAPPCLLVKTFMTKHLKLPAVSLFQACFFTFLCLLVP